MFKIPQIPYIYSMCIHVKKQKEKTKRKEQHAGRLVEEVLRCIEDAAAMTACSHRLQWMVALSQQRLGSSMFIQGAMQRLILLEPGALVLFFVPSAWLTLSMCQVSILPVGNSKGCSPRELPGPVHCHGAIKVFVERRSLEEAKKSSTNFH